MNESPRGSATRFFGGILGHVTLHVVLRHFFLACLTESH